MKERHDMTRSIAALAVVAAAASWATGATAQSIPVMKAEDSRALVPPSKIEPDVKGYGTRAVEGRTLGEMKARCAASAASMSRVEAARCDQLRRTRRTQPGNTAE